MASCSLDENEDELWNDPEWIEEVIRKTKKRERDYDHHIEINEKRQKKTPQITSYFPLLTQPNIESVSKVYVSRFTPGQPAPPVPNKGKNIVIHVSPKYLGGSLSPYNLKDENGNLLENIWQFAKVYYIVEQQKTSISRFHPETIIWEHPLETHVDYVTKKLTEKYWQWRKKGTANPYAVRYPNGFFGRTKCLYSLWPASKTTLGEETDITDADGVVYRKLDYIQARKAIYCGEYARLISNNACFKKIKEMMKKGQTIQIVEVDGPKVEWYKKSPISSAINGQSLAISKSVIEHLINDETHPFGHGYTIAALLLGGASWMTT